MFADAITNISDNYAGTAERLFNQGRTSRIREGEVQMQGSRLRILLVLQAALSSLRHRRLRRLHRRPLRIRHHRLPALEVTIQPIPTEHCTAFR